MKLIAYIRVSTAGQVADGYGLAIQEEAVRTWAKAHDHHIIRIIREEGISGTKDATDRPGLADALLALQEGAANGLLLPRLDRLARELTIQEATLAVAWKAGATVFTVDGGEVLQDDPDDPMRKLLRQITGSIAEFERNMITKRMRDGRAAKAATGRKAVGAYAYGEHGQGEGRERDAAPNPAEMATRDRIIMLRTEGQSYRAIGKVLDAEGLRPRRASHWSAAVVRSVCQKAGIA